MTDDATTDETPQQINHARWEGMAALHGDGTPGGYYDIEALAAGRNPIHEECEDTLRAAFGERGVAGLEVLHVQSHIGMDSVELSRRGARVTCTDFSAEALRRAGEIAARCGVALELVESDSSDLPSSLHDRFDLAYATIGVLCWVEDIDAWMRSVAACLRPGGTLLITDMHPLNDMKETLDPLVLDLPYTFRPGGLHFDEPGSYADPTAELAATRGVVFAHSIGETVTAAADAGLRVRYLREYTEGSFDANGDGLTLEPDGRYRWRVGASTNEPLPVYFGLLADKPVA